MPPLNPEQARWFAEEVQPHEPELRAFLHRHFPTVQDIDDLVQEAYLRLIRARSTGAIAEPRAPSLSLPDGTECRLRSFSTEAGRFAR